MAMGKPDASLAMKKKAYRYFCKHLFLLVGPVGLEPTTKGL